LIIKAGRDFGPDSYRDCDLEIFRFNDKLILARKSQNQKIILRVAGLSWDTVSQRMKEIFISHNVVHKVL
jgi:hypothetical protein